MMNRYFTILLVFISILNSSAQRKDSTKVARQKFNFHIQNTEVVQGDAGFPAKYSGPNSLNSHGEVQETVTLNFYAGVRLWPGAEMHGDFLTWQGFGLSQTFGIEAFPNGDAYKAGTEIPNFSFSHLFIRQTIGLGGAKENVVDDQLTLAGQQDISRITITVGRLSPLDICDDNSYAKDSHTQFMNWATMGNLTWDYGEDPIGYTTGVALELNQPKWALRYGFFQMPNVKNGFTADDQILMYPTRRGSDGPFFRSWAMMLEWERRYYIKSHPGVVRLLSWLDEADFASYQEATAILLANPPDLDVGSGAGITIPAAARAYRFKYGFGLSAEQEVANSIGLFSRIGWNNGKLESWTFTDVNWTVSIGVSVKGKPWHRPGDSFGLADILSGASVANQKFLEAGGTDILDGDGNLSYEPENVIETYYDLHIWKTLHAT